MLFRITMKTPDALADALHEAASDEADKTGHENGSEEWQEAFNRAYALANEVCNKYVEYGELVTIEFSICTGTKTGTARVVPL